MIYCVQDIEYHTYSGAQVAVNGSVVECWQLVDEEAGVVYALDKDDEVNLETETFNWRRYEGVVTWPAGPPKLLRYDPNGE